MADWIRRRPGWALFSRSAHLRLINNVPPMSWVMTNSRKTRNGQTKGRRKKGGQTKGRRPTNRARHPAAAGSGASSGAPRKAGTRAVRKRPAASRGAARRGRSPSTRNRRGARARRPLARIAVYAGHAAASLMIMAVLALGGAYLVIRDLPTTEELTVQAGSPSFIASDGAPILQEGRYVGAEVALADLPPHVVQAALAIEDRNFYHHVGVNPLSIVRALVVNLREGDIRQGGSTITQQLAKNLFLSRDRTIIRKLQEAFLAIRLERRFTKDELLALYLNRAYFGGGAYGIAAAADRYFDKAPTELSVGEAAILAGLLQAPTRYAPNAHPEIAGERAREVLVAMVDAGFLDYFAAEEIASRPIRLRRDPLFAAPYFLDAARRETRDLFGDDRQMPVDAIVRTTLSASAQKALVDGVDAGISLARLPGDVEVAAVLIDGAGAVRAMIGGRDYAASQFNRAVDARRQPGSAFKPFVFLAALEAGASPYDVVSDTPVGVAGWRPSNYGDKFHGDVSLTEALAVSANAATIRVQETIGRPVVRAAARRMGVSSPLSDGPALALGVDVMTPLELAAAYAPFANGGYRVKPYFVERIADPLGRTVERREASYYDRAAEPWAIERMKGMLRAVVTEGTGRAAAIPGVDVGGKTGTSQESRDAWFVGYARGYVLAVWTGRDDNTPMQDITGGGAAAVLWREAMGRVLASDVEPAAAVTPALMSARIVPINEGGPSVAPVAPRRKRSAPR
ncbi:MAG: PBP1A family penicillin-binding protein [Alphaproteobacteria bacterium]|nr:PBP1A family penicillin-binding protein [Alphaproteobacteria bacterium]